MLTMEMNVIQKIEVTDNITRVPKIQKWKLIDIDLACEIQPLDAVNDIDVLAQNMLKAETLYHDPSDIKLNENQRVIINDTEYSLISVARGERKGWPSKSVIAEVEIPHTETVAV